MRQIPSSASAAGKVSDPWNTLTSSWHETGGNLVVIAWSSGRILLLLLLEEFSRGSRLMEPQGSWCFDSGTWVIAPVNTLSLMLLADDFPGLVLPSL